MLADTFFERFTHIAADFGTNGGIQYINLGTGNTVLLDCYFLNVGKSALQNIGLRSLSEWRKVTIPLCLQRKSRTSA